LPSILMVDIFSEDSSETGSAEKTNAGAEKRTTNKRKKQRCGRGQKAFKNKFLSPEIPISIPICGQCMAKETSSKWRVF